MDHNPANGSPASESGNPVDFGHSISTPQSAEGWPNLYGMDFFHPNVPFSGPHMTPMDTEMSIFSDLTPPTSTKDESQLDTPRKSSSLADPDKESKQSRRRTGALETPTDSESATPSMSQAPGANSDTSTPADAVPATGSLPSQHQKQKNQEEDHEPKRDQHQDQSQTNREKNRVAASKCRKKKKEEEKTLLERKEVVELQRKMLESTKKELEEEVLTLKTIILQHGNCNFPPIQNYIQTAASRIQALAPNTFAHMG